MTALTNAFVLCCALSGGVAAAQLIEGRVVGVTDGDTITVVDDKRQQHMIRLAGIDAPEKRQGFGNRSKQSLSDLAAPPWEFRRI